MGCNELEVVQLSVSTQDNYINVLFSVFSTQYSDGYRKPDDKFLGGLHSHPEAHFLFNCFICRHITEEAEEDPI